MLKKKYAYFFVMLFITLITCTVLSAADTTNTSNVDNSFITDTSSSDYIQIDTISESNNNIQEVDAVEEKQITRQDDKNLKEENAYTYFNYYADSNQEKEYTENSLTTHVNTEESLYITVENSMSSSSPLTTAGNITVSYNGQELARVTNPNSITQPAVLKFEEAGTYELNVAFVSGGYFDGSGIFTVIVLDEGQLIPLTLDVDDVEGTVGETATVTIDTTPQISQGTVTVKKDEETIATVNLSESNSFTLSLDEVTTEPYTLILSYLDENGEYEADDTTITVTVNKVVTPFTMNVSSTRMTEGQTKKFIINTNTTVNQGIVTVTNGATTIATVDLSEDNTFKYTYTSSSYYSSSETLTLTYTDALKDYAANTTTVRIEKHTPSSSYYFNYYADSEKQVEYNNELTTTVGKEETLYVEPQNYYSAITYSGNISVYLNDDEIKRITNPNSITQPITFSFDQTGEYTLTFEFICSYSTYDILQNFTVTVLEEGQLIPVTLNVDDVEGTVGDTKTVTISTDPTISQGTVTVKKDESIIATVDLSQTNSFDLILDEVTAEPYTLTLSYSDENGEYEAEDTEITVTVNKVVTPFTMSVNATRMYDGQTKTFTINTNTSVNQGIVTVKNGNTIIAEVDLSESNTFKYTFVSSGYYYSSETLTLSYDDSLKDYAANDTTVRIVGISASSYSYFNYYADSQKEVEYNNELTTNPGKEETLYVTPEYYSSTVSYAGNISVYYNDEEIASITHPDSITQPITFKFDQIGEYNLTLVFICSYSSYDIVQNFTVKVEPTPITITVEDVSLTRGQTQTVTINTDPEIEQGIVTVKNGDEEIAKVDLAQSNTFDLTYDEELSYPLTLTLSYNDETSTYTMQEDATFNVFKEQIEIELSVESITGIQEDVKTVTVNTNPSITQGIVTVTDDDTIIATVDLSNDNTFEYTLTQSTTLTLTYNDEKEDYIAESINVDVEVESNEPTNITVTIDPILAQVDTTKTVTINTNPEVNKGIVTVKDADTIIATVDLSETNTFDYTSTKIISTAKTLTITYEDTTGDYIADDSTTTLTVTKQDVTINIDELNLVAGKTTTFTARLTDDNGNPINIGKVVFKINGKTIKDETTGKVIYVKVVDGVASLDYNINQSWVGKELNISVVYSGAVKVNSARNNSIAIVETVSEGLKVSITPFDESVKRGSNITLQAKVTVDSTAVTTGKVVFKINGKTIKDENNKVLYFSLDENGEVSYDYNLGSLKAKTYTVDVIFISPIYDRTSDSTSLTITA